MASVEIRFAHPNVIPVVTATRIDHQQASKLAIVEQEGLVLLRGFVRLSGKGCKQDFVLTLSDKVEPTVLQIVY